MELCLHQILSCHATPRHDQRSPITAERAYQAREPFDDEVSTMSQKNDFRATAQRRNDGLCMANVVEGPVAAWWCHGALRSFAPCAPD